MKQGIGKHFISRLSEIVLATDLFDLKGARRFFIKWTRIAAIAVRESYRNKVSLRAASLTYVTLVSIVPVFAFAFSIGKGLGFSDKLKNFLISKAAASTALSAGHETGGVSFALEKIFNYIEKTNFETLGVVGVVMLVYLVIQLLGNIETTFNDIWGVTVQRSIRRKFTDYISVVVIFPFFVLVAATGTAVLASHTFSGLLYAKGTAGVLIRFIIGYASYVFLWLAFFALYMFMPNTRVKVGSAVIGGIIGGTLWQVIQWLYFHFQIGIAKYNVIYSTMASLPVFLVWLYMSWEILLFGAEITFAHQTVRTYRFAEMGEKLWKKASEIFGLSLVVLIAKNFLEGNKPLGIKHLSDALGVKPAVIKPILDSLKKNDIIVDATGTGAAYLLTVAPDKLSPIQVIDAVSGGSEPDVPVNRIQPEVYRFYTGMNRRVQEVYRDYTIAGLLNREEEPRSADEENGRGGRI